MSGDAGPADGDVEAGIPLSKSVREIAYHESFKVANKEIAKLNAENIALKLQLHRISGGTDVEEMESLDELKLAKGNLVAKVTELNVRLEGQHSQHVLDKKEIDSLLSRVKQLADDNCFHTQESHDRAKQAASLTTERDTLKQNLSEIELKCESLTTSNALLKESNSTLHANLTKVSTESAAEIKTLRAEKADALAQSSRSGALHEELKEKYRLISADLESVEESKADEIRGLHEEVAALKDSYQLIDKKAASLAQELEEEQEKKALLEQELATMRDIANDTVQHADQRFFASEKKLEEAIAARNTAEVEVVSLQKKLNTLHPLLSDTQEEGVSVPFSFSQIIEMDANKKIAEEQLLSMQDLYKEATSSKEHDLQTIKKEKARSEQLAEEILDLRFSLSKVEKEQTQLAQWKRDNQLVVNQAKDAVKMNEMLSTQLQYILHEGREDKLDIEYSDIKELQQQNTKLTTQALSIERNHEEEMAAMRESLEETFLARIAKMEEQAAALATERADLEAALSDSAEKCRRLAHSLEICGSRRHQFVTTPHMPAAAPPQTVPMETSSLMEPEDTDNSQELQLLREEVDRLKHELFEAHRNRETSDASFLRLTATIDSRDDTVAHLRDEKEYYKSLMEHSDKSMDEMLKRLLATEEKYRRQQRSEATLEVRLEQALRENEQLLTTNTSFAQGQSKLNDVILHVDAVVGHVNSENLTAEATMRSQRDEVRQKLAEKEKELQESNNVARNLRAQHEQTLTDLNVELATVKEQLVSTTRRFEEEKDAHKHQIIHNKKLGADLDRAESERRIRDKQKVEEGENFLVSDSGEKELRGELAEALKGKAAVAAKVEAYVTTIRKLETELTQCNQRMQEMDTNLAEQQKRGDEAEAREKSRTETWKQDNENLRAREEEVRKTAVNFKASTEALQTRNDALQYELKSGEDERKEALRRCKEAEDEANKIKERYETALVEKGELTKTLQDYHEANSAVHIAPADTRPSLAEGREQQLLAEIATLRSELENVRVTLDSIDPAEGIREHHLAITLDGMRGHSRDLQQRLRDAERGSKLLEAQIDQLKRQQQLAAKQSSQTDAIGKYERRIQNLKDDLQERTHSEEKLRKELEQAQCSKAEVKNAEEVRANLKVVLREKAALENSVRQLTPKANEASKLRETLNAKCSAFTQLKQEADNTKTNLLRAEKERRELKEVGARLAKEKDDVQRRLNAAVTEERLEKSRRLAIESEKQKLEEKIKAEENAKRANDAERSASEKAKQQTELQELLKKKDAAVAALATAERKKQEAKDIPTFSAPPATPSSPAETPLAASSSSPPANDPSPVAVSASSLTAVTPPVSSQPPPIPALKRLNDPMEPIVKMRKIETGAPMVTAPLPVSSLPPALPVSTGQMGSTEQSPFLAPFTGGAKTFAPPGVDAWASDTGSGGDAFGKAPKPGPAVKAFELPKDNPFKRSRDW